MRSAISDRTPSLLAASDHGVVITMFARCSLHIAWGNWCSKKSRPPGLYSHCIWSQCPCEWDSIEGRTYTCGCGYCRVLGSSAPLWCKGQKGLLLPCVKGWYEGCPSPRPPPSSIITAIATVYSVMAAQITCYSRLHKGTDCLLFRKHFDWTSADQGMVVCRGLLWVVPIFGAGAYLFTATQLTRGLLSLSASRRPALSLD